MYQRRLVDIPADVDFTQNTLGQNVVTETSSIVACPGCGRNSVFEQTDNGGLYVHRRLYSGQTVEGCMERPDGEPGLVIWDANGKPQYIGNIAPPEAQN